MGKDITETSRRSVEQERRVMDKLVLIVEGVADNQKHQQTILNGLTSDMTEFRLEIQKLTLTHSAFIKANQDKMMVCDKKHDDFELRLRTTPTGTQCADHKDRLETLEKEQKDNTKTIYKAIGSVSAIIFVITVILPWALKRFGG